MHESFFKHEYLLHVDDTSLSVNNLYNLVNKVFICLRKHEELGR
jgi:hypothetical protein